MKSKPTRKESDLINAKQKQSIAQSPYKNTPKLGEAMNRSFQKK